MILPHGHSAGRSQREEKVQYCVWFHRSPREKEKVPAAKGSVDENHLPMDCIDQYLGNGGLEAAV